MKITLSKEELKKIVISYFNMNSNRHDFELVIVRKKNQKKVKVNENEKVKALRNILAPFFPNGRLDPNQKIAAIRQLREFIYTATGSSYSLVAAKNAVENFERYLVAVSETDTFVNNFS